MKYFNKKSLFALATLVSLVAIANAEPLDAYHRKNKDKHHKVETVAEGGSSLAYLLGAGAACLGAIFLKSRSKPKTV